MEHLVADKRVRFFVHRDLADYEGSVQANIPQRGVVFVDKLESIFSPIKAKAGRIAFVRRRRDVTNAIYCRQRKQS